MQCFRPYTSRVYLDLPHLPTQSLRLRSVVGLVRHSLLILSLAPLTPYHSSEFRLRSVFTGVYEHIERFCTFQRSPSPTVGVTHSIIRVILALIDHGCYFAIIA